MTRFLLIISLDTNIMQPRQDLLDRALILTVSILAAVTINFTISSPAVAGESCVQLLTTRCETCHYLTRVCQKVDKERNKKSWFGGSAGTWKRTMKNMVKQGAQLNKEEEEILVDCLSKPTPEVLNICKLGKK